jgi:hypothetical protein
MSDGLKAALDTMLPGDAGFPAASDVDLAERLLENPYFAEPARAAAALLPQNLADASPEARVAAIGALERDHPETFARFIMAVYSGYYIAPAVLQAVEQATGYAARPPQPEGYVLKQFDPAWLAVPASRPPHYRTVPEPT